MVEPHATAPTLTATAAEPHSVSVLLPLALDVAYDYRVPEGIEVAPGAIVEVPLGQRQVIGVVWGTAEGGIAPARLKDIAAVRAVFPGRLTYAAHNVEEAEAVAFWDALDAVGVTLYPPLGADGDRPARQAAMGAAAERLQAIASRTGKPVIVAEIGLRSARGAAAKPWESAEERGAPPDPALQAEVLADWLAALDRPAIVGVLVWRWFTDPAAGGPSDTDFTVQGKPAERMLRCAWTRAC